MKYILNTFLLLIISSSCHYDDDPIGHWHVDTSDSNFDSYFTIDFEADSVIIGNKYSINPYLGKYTSDENEIYIGENTSHEYDTWGESYYGYLKYKIKGNKIYLDEYLVDRKLVGFRCDSNCCNKKDDFLNITEIKVEIDLHEIIKKRNELNPISLEDKYFTNLLVGHPTLPYSSGHFWNYPFVLQLNDKFSSTEFISFFIEERLLNHKKDNIHFRIFAEKSTPISRLKEIVLALRKEEIKNIWLVCANPNEDVLFEYIHLDSLDLDREGGLEDVLY